MLDLSKLTTPKVNELREYLNLTEDEEIIFDMLAKKKSILDISIKLQMSRSSVDRRIRSIKNKMESNKTEL